MIEKNKKLLIVLLINLLLAISTTIGMTIIPILVTDGLGLSLLVLGLIEGTSEFISNAMRLANGILFDKASNKRTVFLLPTLLALSSKMILLFPSGWSILCAKIVERMSNGAFASPRDAYVGEQATNKGFALSLISVSKTIGCVLGPVLVSLSAIYLGKLSDNTHILVLLCCSLCLSAILLSLRIQSNSTLKASEPFAWSEISKVSKEILPILIVGILFFASRFNDGLLMIFLKQHGLPEWFYLSTIAIFNFTMLLTSPWIGSQIDHGKVKKMLYVTIASLLIFNLSFYQLHFAPWTFAILGLITWGIQRTGAQIVFASLVFSRLPKHYYGTGIGLFYISTGFATMLASFICGYLAQHYFQMVFVYSGLMTGLTLLYALAVYTPKKAMQNKSNSV